MIDENEFFRKATLMICSSLNADTALKRTMNYIQNHIPLSGVGLGIYVDELNAGKILSMIWPPYWKKPPNPIFFSKEMGKWVKKNWMREPQVKIINDIQKEEPVIQATMYDIWPDDSSHLFLDLELEKKRLGRLLFFAKGKNRYEKAHAKLASVLHEPFAMALSNILHHRETEKLKDLLAEDNQFLQKELHEKSGSRIVGADFGLFDVMEMVRQVAALNSPVLLLGETGVGKEVIANAIHFFSERKDHPFIKVNCGAIPESLIDSELFGHEKGAFTGAASRKRGRLERAHTGTIFLDEVGELPPAAQVRLLRVLQHHEIERVGGTEAVPINIRIISATHRDLIDLVKKGRFREDLWFRLNVFPIVIPPLRHRTEDIPALISHFIERKSREMKIKVHQEIGSDVVTQLKAYPWPGNVRELENAVERALIQSQTPKRKGRLIFDTLILSPDKTEEEEDKKDSVNKPSPVCPLDEMITAHIEKALKACGGKVEGADGAAKMLALNPSTLRARMRKLGIDFGKQNRNT